MKNVKRLTKVEIDALDTELMLTFESTLTEARYNEIMDALLPTLEGFADAQATLKTLGKDKWRERRAARIRSFKTTASAA